MNRTGAQFNRVSGRIESGNAVTAKVFTLGNSFELSGRDFYEKDKRDIQSIKENRLSVNDRRRRQASQRARAEKERMQQNHRAHLASSSAHTDRFDNKVFARSDRAPTVRKDALSRRPQRSSNFKSDIERSHNNNKNPRRMPSKAPSSRSVRASPRSPPRSPLHSPNKGSECSSPDLGNVGIMTTNSRKQQYDTRAALEERQAHEDRMLRAKNMQRGGDGDVGMREDEGIWYTGRNAHKDRLPKFKSQKSNETPAYLQAKNTRKPDAYLNILLGKNEEDEEGEREHSSSSHEGKHNEGKLINDKEFERRAKALEQKYGSGGRGASCKSGSPDKSEYFPADELSPRHAVTSSHDSPSSAQKAMALEKELKRKKRLFEIEQGLNSSRGSKSPRSPRSPRSELEILKNQNGNKSNNLNKQKSSAMEKRCEPLARRIERRKQKEQQKMMDANVTRLIRAVKSVVVELQLCVWEWAKKPTFKSKDVARSRRIKLRRTLHRLLDDHRHAVMDLITAVRNWAQARSKQTFMWNDEWDVLDLVRMLFFSDDVIDQYN
jgi:hypothetical protein